MSNSWFRLYAEFATDPKVQTLSEAMQRRFIMLMCLQCDGSLQKLTDKEIAYALGITEKKLSETFQNFFEKMLIYRDEKNSGKIFITNWDKRQYVSDTSTDRVKKHREKIANETFQKRYRNDTETPPDTDTDTDTEKTEKISKLSPSQSDLNNKADKYIPHPETDAGSVGKPKKPKKAARKIEYSKTFEDFFDIWPIRKGKSEAYESWQAIKEAGVYKAGDIINAAKAQLAAGMLIPGDPLNPCTYLSTWLNQHRWEDEAKRVTKKESPKEEQPSLFQNRELLDLTHETK